MYPRLEISTVTNNTIYLTRSIVINYRCLYLYLFSKSSFLLFQGFIQGFTTFIIDIGSYQAFYYFYTTSNSILFQIQQIIQTTNLSNKFTRCQTRYCSIRCSCRKLPDAFRSGITCNKNPLRIGFTILSTNNITTLIQLN